ncbi:HlyD family secretion protein [Rhizobium paknamense]|uniref:Membrane fusion protein (Multidrug efflux system) n=1 Tax=Rhizobium paknamense TaxID=1206817 RepID=A0ABU0IDA7_9HYPH|nr:HlyD family secretion protein [Rhizobium paknamense]MDQ0456205.1 membrane fusion protein (multidrug efflux system) [Rhizobium paknamense]
MSVSSRKGAVRAVDTTEDAVVADDAKVSADAARAEAPEARREQASVAAPPSEAPAKPARKRRSPVLPILGIALLAAGGFYGYNWWTEGRFLVSTDDAYVQGDIAIITPKVSGYVQSVEFTENQHVKAGDVLVRLDDGDYRIALDQAKSELDTQKLTVSRIEAQIKGGEASLEQAKAQKLAYDATLQTAEINFRRVTDLQAQSVVSKSELDTATSTLATARANVAASVASIAYAQASLDVLKGQRDEAVATVRTDELAVVKAQRDLDFTVLRAPYDGVIGNRGVQVGDYVSSSKRLAALVPVSQLFIEANFKETQLAHIEPGSKVRVHVDAWDEHPFEGTVVSLAPGSGSVFSVLPPENATGNFTKVIQRVPVRIAIPDDVLAKGHMRAGLSVVVDVDTRTAPSANK